MSSSESSARSPIKGSSTEGSSIKGSSTKGSSARGQPAAPDARNAPDTSDGPGAGPPASSAADRATASEAAPSTESLAEPVERFRLLFTAALASVLLSYLLAVLVAALAGLTGGAEPAMKSLLRVAVPLWLAAHQVPLIVDGAPLGVLPLLPTMALAALVGTLAGRVVGRLGGRPREDAATVIATLGGAHASVAVLATALPSSPAPATPWDALLGAGLVTAGSAGVGVLRVTGPPPWWSRLSDWVRAGFGAAVVGGFALLTGGALMLLGGLLAEFADVHARLLEFAPGFGAGVGVTLLSLCYLPNALVVSVAWLVGPGFSIGAAAASPLFTSAGPLPPIPLMAAMPVVNPPAWAVVVFVLPATAGLLVGRRLRSVHPEPAGRMPSVVVAATTVAVAAALLSAVVSGRLAEGPFDPVRVSPLAVGAAVLLWIGIPSVAVALLPDRPLARSRIRGPAGTARPAPRSGVRRPREGERIRQPIRPNRLTDDTEGSGG